MKIFIAQPKCSEKLVELKSALENNDCDVVVFPEGYIHNESRLSEVCELARESKTAIVTSYLAEDDRTDRAVLINENGGIEFNRKKSKMEGPLLKPSLGTICGKSIGYMLCCEIFLDYDDIKNADIIFNPIGVGMFSENQFEEWSNRAVKIAEDTNSLVIGASHADGSYRNCGYSIPISFVIGKEGNVIYLSKNDNRSFIIDLDNNQVQFV